MKRALVTGITGQDGSYLAELLLSKGYEVHGIIRRASTFNTKRIDHIYQDPNQPSTRLFLHHGDLSSTEWVLNLVYSFAPDELYHLAAQSHVRVSFDMAEYTGDITGLCRRSRRRSESDWRDSVQRESACEGLRQQILLGCWRWCRISNLAFDCDAKWQRLSAHIFFQFERRDSRPT
jgi:hypothetical protein